MKKNYLCIHGHFYQPPRENPWLEAIQQQVSAHPYHDWNERVTRECYGPNSRARVADGQGHILKLINNYEFMNFDFGPTLLSWLEKAQPWIYEQILAADRSSCARLQGHGNGMAQVYNHMIMPLATTRDKVTQIRWGIADFEHRFGRRPEGMWLAETAVDLETLALMAREGIRFTVLAPTQAKAVRTLGEGEEKWETCSAEKLDTTRPYRVFPDPHSSLHLDVFFYNGVLSKAVAYEKILSSGHAFLGRIQNSVDKQAEGARLVNVATDGESYGHHYKFGDMAVGWLFDHLQKSGGFQLCSYGWFLEKYPPRMEVCIKEKSSWSCAHGIERWRADCGCSVANKAGWNQAWRSPLRKTMEWLSRELATIFEDRGGIFLNNPWEARDDYITVLLDPTPQGRRLFLEKHGVRKDLDPEAMVHSFRLLESQRMGMYMFTSCGWFFDDISGLEATQVLMYADRAMTLVREWSKSDLESRFLSRLANAKSNDPKSGDGKSVFQNCVVRTRMHAGKIAAGWAMRKLFSIESKEPLTDTGRVQALEEEEVSVSGGKGKKGQLRVVDPMTGATTNLTFFVQWKGEANIACRVQSDAIEDANYTLKDMGPDTEQAIRNSLSRRVMNTIQSKVLENEELVDAFLKIGKGGRKAWGEENVLHDFLRILLRTELWAMEGKSCEEMRNRTAKIYKLACSDKHGILLNIDDPEVKKNAEALIDFQMERIAKRPDPECMEALMNYLDLLEHLSLSPDLWVCQNRYWDLFRDKQFMNQLAGKEGIVFKRLGKRLGFVL